MDYHCKNCKTDFSISASPEKTPQEVTCPVCRAVRRLPKYEGLTFSNAPQAGGIYLNSDDSVWEPEKK